MRKFLFFSSILIIAAAAFLLPKSVQACGESCWTYYDYCPDYSQYNSWKYCASTEVCKGNWYSSWCPSTGNNQWWLSGWCEYSAACACKCTSGVCCDGCNYRPSSYICNDWYATEYGCPYGTGCDSDVYYRRKVQYCSGSSSSCTGSISGWSSWVVYSYCSSYQYCVAGSPSCQSQCSSGVCCDGCRYKSSSNSCSSWTEYGCPWGTSCGADVGKRTATQYCSGSSSSCTGSVSYGGWSVQQDCTSMQTCAVGGSTCNLTTSCDTTAPSGTLSVSPNPALVGQTITITITGTDNYDVGQLQAKYSGSWHTQWCDGVQTSCTKTWTTSESSVGTYTYEGFVYDSNSNGAWTSPSSINVNVISCNNPTGTISASKTSVNTGETFTISITGYDDNDVWYISSNEGSNSWNDSTAQQCVGAQTSCTKSWNYSKSTAGTYTYYGRVRDSDDVHSCPSWHEAGIGSVTVTVTVPDNPPTGTLNVSPASVCPGSTITISITGNDDIDIDQLQAKYSGSWHTQWCDGVQTSCTKYWYISESTPGTYTYQGFIYDSKSQGAWTTPDSKNVTVPDCSGTDRYCSAGSCISCTAPYKNCDSNPANGCEVNTNTDPNNCGSCGNVCAGGVCKIVANIPPCAQGDCDVACKNRGYPGGYCAATDYARESCLLAGYSINVVNIHDQWSCTETSFPTIKSCQCCQPMINTQITGFGFDPSSITLGQQTAVRGYLKTAGGTGINGETLTLMYYGADSVWHSTGQSGTTDATGTGYMGFYWTPSSFYQGTVSYRLEFATHGNYNSSQSASTNLTVTAACAAPGIPASPCSQQSAHAINFSWNSVSGATNYRAEWCNASYNFGDVNCCTGTCYAVTSATSYYVYGLNTGTSYKFRVSVDSATGCNVPPLASRNWSSTQQCATLSQDVVDCNNECSRRGYANPGDCYPLIGGYIPCGGSQTNYGDPIGKYGACSGLFVGGCVCCHNCPNPPVSDYVSVGSCSTAITGKGWDATDGVIFGYRHLDKDGTWRTFSMDDNPGDNTCTDDLQLKNSWTVSGNTITVTTDVVAKGGTHSLGGGFDFNPGGCKYTVSKIGVAGNGNETYTNGNACMTGTNPLGITGGADPGEYVRWLIDMEYCGDGQCNCGETCTSCLGDCGACDTTPPTTKITNISLAPKYDASNKAWLRAYDDGSDRTYTITISDSDNTGGSGLDYCVYELYDSTTGYVKSPGTSRTCNSTISFTVGATGDCRTTNARDSCKLYVSSKDRANLWSVPTIEPLDERDYTTQGTNSFKFDIDFTPPTTQIR